MSETNSTTSAAPPKAIHIANTADGSYDVRKPLPYPYHVEADGSIARQDYWRGQPARLAGFQRQADVQHVDVLAETWLADPDLDVVGMFPVFIDEDGSMWNSTTPVSA
ncbi:hypothetical protein [Nocardioides sp. InS609-2]|uniref:hypothetical protein n=1 Tax=Nocardioides sp. InS609-2 TaxID=2760705 RepID=UPI0020BE824E|nr:hypothetical protein [Nocardioides sp. InS609-2]